jgi:transcriptional regulator with XRE-family HTH domain
MRERGAPRRTNRLLAVRTHADVASELTRLRQTANLTVRDVAKLSGISAGTLSGYFSGKHMPRVQDRRRLLRIVQACGVTDPAEYAAWSHMVEQVYGLAKDEPRGEGFDGPPPRLPPASLRPPVERLDREPLLRGRAELLSELAETVRGLASPKVRVLHGLGGVGKSFTALYLARWARTRGYRTWWLPAGESVSATLGLRALALQLGASPRQLDLGSPVDIAWELLGALPSHWLLVIDNADDPVQDFLADGGPVTDANGWLKPLQGKHGTIVVTTRDGSRRAWGERSSWLKLHRLSPLGIPDATQVLYELAGDTAGTYAEATSVATRLDGLPLALRLAGLHIREAHRIPAGFAWSALAGSFAEYGRALDAGGHLNVLSAPETDRDPRRRIDQTWEISLDALETRGLGDARPLLQLLSCFANAQIPYTVMLAPEILERSELFTDRLTHKSLWRLLTALFDLGLIEFERDVTGGTSVEEEGTLRLHPVLRAVCRRSPGVREDLDAYLALVMELTGRNTRSLYPSDPVSWPHWSAVTVHCHSAIDLFLEAGDPSAPVPDGLLRPAMAAAQYLRASGRFAEAEAAYAVLLRRCETLFGPAHAEVLAVRQGLCRVWYGMGRLRYAETALRTLLDDRTALLGSEHRVEGPPQGTGPEPSRHALLAGKPRRFLAGERAAAT